MFNQEPPEEKVTQKGKSEGVLIQVGRDYFKFIRINILTGNWWVVIINLLIVFLVIYGIGNGAKITIDYISISIQKIITTFNQNTTTTSRKSNSPTEENWNNLKLLLSTGQWKEADIETKGLLLKASGEDIKGAIDPLVNVEILQVPCDTLRGIDQLWLTYSGGRFGFSVQSRIWQEVRGAMLMNKVDNPSSNSEHNQQVKNFWIAYGKRLEWFDEDASSYSAKNYSNVNFRLTAPEGHLPCGGLGCSTYYAMSGALTQKVASCGIR
jgi:hypothetical protein